MYFKIGGVFRPFQEVDAAISAELRFDGSRRLVATRQVWQISGRLVLQEDATQTNMTAALGQLDQDYRQERPDLIFYQDDQTTPSHLQLLRANCLDGPNLTNFSYPQSPDKVYANCVPYAATFEADVPINSAGNPIMEFREEVIDVGSGGWERVHVGGTINPPEEQIGTQFNVYRYQQTGSAVGLYDYPQIPPPIWPAALKRPNPRKVKSSPEVQGPVKQRFRIQWTYEYEASYELFGNPHFL